MPEGRSEQEMSDLSGYEPIHGSQVRYCGNRFSRGQFRLIMAVVVLVTFVVALLLGIFVGGRSLAQSQLNSSEIIIKMVINKFEEDSVEINVFGSVDNRGSFKALLKEAHLPMYYGGQKLGTMKFPALEIAGSASTALNITTTIKVDADDRPGFDAYSAALMREERVTVSMQAKISVKAMGISFNSLDFTKLVVQDGIDSFSNPPPRVVSQRVVKGEENRLTVKLVTEMYNPADVAMKDVGHLNLTMMYAGKIIGYSLADDAHVSLMFGTNILNLTGYILRDSSNVEVIDTLLSNYMSGVDSPIVLLGNEYTTDIPLLKNAMSHFIAHSTFPGVTHLEDKLLGGVYNYIPENLYDLVEPVRCDYTEDDFGSLGMPVYIFAHNPLDAAQVLEAYNFNITWLGVPELNISSGFFGNTREKDINFIIPPRGTRQQTQMLCIMMGGKTAVALLDLINSGAVDNTGVVPWPMFIDIEGYIIGGVEDFKNVRISYNQRNILVQTITPWFTKAPTSAPSAPTAPTTEAPTGPPTTEAPTAFF